MGTLSMHGRYPHDWKLMAYQLIYTSWQTSLVRGRTGFSTVARSRGMSERLGAAVERCCVYDNSAPVVWAHSRIEQGAVAWHVLSRVCDSGVDYTNRNNYLAHHLVFSEEEIETLKFGPADIMLGWKGWVSSWNEDPKWLDDEADLSSVHVEAALPAKNWREIFGDAGCAALLDTSASAIVRSEPSHAEILLKLFRESSALSVNRRDAWRPTFTTRFAVGDNPANFLWRGVVSESAGIDIVRRKCPPAPVGRRAEYARTGIMNNLERYGLKVGAPKVIRPDFKVVEVHSNPFPFKIVALSSSVGIAAAAILFFAFSGSKKVGGDFSRSGEKLSQAVSLVSDFKVSDPADAFERSLQKASDSNSAAVVDGNIPSRTLAPSNSDSRLLSEVVDEAREKIAADDFAGALESFGKSKFSGDRQLAASILSDIGYRIDYLLQYAENVLSLDSASSDDFARACTGLAAARDGLDSDPSVRTAARMLKWKTLNARIKK